MKKSLVVVVAGVVGMGLLSVAPASGAATSGPDLAPAAPAVAAASPGTSLATPAGSPEATVAAYLREHGRSAAVIASLRVDARVPGAGGMTHLRMSQTVTGLAVAGAYLKAAVNSRGQLVQVIDALADVTAPTGAAVDAPGALRAAMAATHPAGPATSATVGTSGNTTTFAKGSFFAAAPTATRVLLPMSNGALARGWLVSTWTRAGNQLDDSLVGPDGRVLAVVPRTASDDYNVFAEDPGKNPQAIVPGPGATLESPLGWLGTGAQTTTTITGNNTRTYRDADANNAPDPGGTTVTDGRFTTVADLTTAPTTTANQAVASQNLFYLNNRIHDLLYGHGFTEAAGNFQTDNVSRGGAGNDAVLAEAQDGGGTDNANFSTPADGSAPRMQMYLWTGYGPTHEVAITSPSAASYGATGAAFGPALTTTGVAGSIVRATPADACTTVSNAVSGKVALVDRGTCDFSAKVLNAQKAGAVAVIVANNSDSKIFAMGAGTGANRVRIPSVMVSLTAGTALKATASPVGTLRALPAAQQPLQIDGSVDSDIVYHEYCHGLTWRMIGGMSGPLAGAIGEGMSDGCSLLINGGAVVGEYAYSDPAGIRRYPYDTYPLTYGDVTGAEVHDDGEIYAAIVWKLSDLFGSARRDALFDYVVDGMNYTPSTPSYEKMRDGILQSVANTTGSAADTCLVWDAFAQYGVGVGATGTVSRRGAVKITESFAKPSTCP